MISMGMDVHIATFLDYGTYTAATPTASMTAFPEGKEDATGGTPDDVVIAAGVAASSWLPTGMAMTQHHT